MHKMEQETKLNLEKAEKMNQETDKLNQKQAQIATQIESHQEEAERKPDMDYSRKFGFEPTKFTIINDNENVQLDAKMESDPICSSAGCTQYKHKKKSLGYDINYFVPHFGADTEINESKASLATAEEMIGHKFDFPNAKWKKPKAVKYTSVAPYDEDIVDSVKNLADSEKQLGHTWSLDG